MRPAAVLLLLLGAACSLVAAEEEEEEEEIQIDAVEPGTVEGNTETDVVTITGPFVARYKGAVLTAQRGGRLDGRTGEILAEGDVVLQSDEAVWRGARLEYNFRTKQIRTDQFRTGRTPFFAAGEGLSADLTNKTYTATNTFVTSDDVDAPAAACSVPPVTA